MKNKALKNEAVKQGKEHFTFSGFQHRIAKDPLAFANSDKLNKIRNRNKKRK